MNLATFCNFLYEADLLRGGKLHIRNHCPQKHIKPSRKKLLFKFLKNYRLTGLKGYSLLRNLSIDSKGSFLLIFRALP